MKISRTFLYDMTHHLIVDVPRPIKHYSFYQFDQRGETLFWRELLKNCLNNFRFYVNHTVTSLHLFNWIVFRSSHAQRSWYSCYKYQLHINIRVKFVLQRHVYISQRYHLKKCMKSKQLTTSSSVHDSNLMIEPRGVSFTIINL
jgi:hypothetical protein